MTTSTDYKIILDDLLGEAALPQSAVVSCIMNDFDTIPKSLRESVDHGPWFDEPDSFLFIDPETGYHCAVLRAKSLHLCGYVLVPDTHRATYLHEDDAYELDLCPRRISYVGVELTGHLGHLEQGHDLAVGFDCSQGYDYVPGFTGFSDLSRIVRQDPKAYRSFAYVIDMVQTMAQSLKHMEA